MAFIVFGNSLTHVNRQEIDYQKHNLALCYKDELLPLLTQDKWLVTSTSPLKLIHTVSRKIKRIFIERPTDSDRNTKVKIDKMMEDSTSDEMLSENSEEEDNGDNVDNLDNAIASEPSAKHISDRKCE